MRQPESVSFDEAKLASALRSLEHKKAQRRDLIGLGESLADHLMPARVRDMFVRSLDRIPAHEGLRLRLVLNFLVDNDLELVLTSVAGTLSGTLIS